MRAGFIALAIVALVVAEAPLALAWCCGPRDLAGLGTFWFINDFAQYESAMDQGAHTAGWLVYDRFTPEAHQPALMFPFYVGLGKLAALAAAPPEAVYRLAEIVSRLALVWSLAGFLGWLLGAGRVALLAMGLSLFGMGLGLPLAVAGALLGLSGVYTGNGSYEVNTFGLLFSAPHAALAMALTLAMPVAYAAYVDKPRLTPLILLAGASFGTALLHPFHLPIMLGALAIDGAIRARAGTPPLRVGLAIALPAVLAVPLLVYTALTFNLDPFWGATYGAQNLLPSPRPWELPIDYGVVLLLAVVGVASLAQRPGASWRLVLIWCAAMLVAMYLPLPYQRRFSFGLQLALAALAAVGVLRAEAWLRRGGRERMARLVQPVTLALALATTATAAGGIAVSAAAQEPMRPYRATGAEATASAWLAGTLQPGQLVLADWDTSNYLAGRLPGRVLGGHPVATLGPTERRREIAEFFSSDDETRRRFLESRQISYVFYGARERALSSLEGVAGLAPVYEQPGVTVFAVRRGRG